MELDNIGKMGYKYYKYGRSTDKLYYEFLKNPFGDWLIGLYPEITKCPDKIKDFINSCRVEFCEISSLEVVSKLAEAFRNEHNSREYGLGDDYLEDTVENVLVGYCEDDLGKGSIEEELPVISGGVLLKAGYQNPLTKDYAFEYAGFVSVLELGLGIELSAIYLAAEFRGKELEGKRCSELLLEEAIRYVNNRYPLRVILAYVEKNNILPRFLLEKFGFKMCETDKLNYYMYVRD